MAASVLLVIAIVAVGCVLALGHRPHPARADAPPGSPVRSSASTTGSPSVQDPVPPGQQGGTGAAPPIRVSVPRLNISSSLQNLHLLKNGALQAPTKWQVAGWYSNGTRPGDVGPAVIAGHVDSTSGPAVFFRLSSMRTGDKIQVTESGGKVLTFIVTAKHAYPKNKFPSQTVYGPTALPELRLVTCTGDFDYVHHNYLDNLVVFAVLAGALAG